MLRIATMAVVLLTTCHLTAQEQSKLSVHGFVSQGYVQSDKHDYLVEGSRDGSFEFTEMAVNVFARPMPKLSVGLQIFARDLGREGNNEPVIDWAVADYRHRDALGFRLGKIKAPLGFYNKGRDADILRPSVFLPQGVYNEDYRDITLSYQGFNVYGNMAGGALDYEVYVGTTNVDEEQRLFRSLIMQLGGAPAGTRIEVEKLYGGALRWAAPPDGLSLGAAQVRADGAVEDSGTGLELTIDGTTVTTLSVEYARGAWLFSSEYSQIRLPLRNGHMGYPFPDLPDFQPIAYYVQAAWQVRDAIQLSYQYDVSYADKDDHHGDRYLALQLPDFFAWQKDHAFSLRYDLSGHVTLKGEVRLIDGVQRALPGQGPWSQHWSFYAAKASFNF